jgi:hypothetical protein
MFLNWMLKPLIIEKMQAFIWLNAIINNVNYVKNKKLKLGYL